MSPRPLSAGASVLDAGHRFTRKEAVMFDATHPIATNAGHRTVRRRKPAEYRIYYAIVFAVALPIAVLSRLLPREAGYLERARPARRSVLGEARALTDSVIPYLFMN